MQRMQFTCYRDLVHKLQDLLTPNSFLAHGAVTAVPVMVVPMVFAVLLVHGMLDVHVLALRASSCSCLALCQRAGRHAQGARCLNHTNGAQTLHCSGEHFNRVSPSCVVANDTSSERTALGRDRG